VNKEGDPDHYWYTKSTRLIPRGQYGTGYWHITDPQHPDYLDTEAQPAPIEEFIAGGTHHIVTLQGAQSLSQEAPILPEIAAAAAAGISIPTDIPPVASAGHSPSVPTMSAQIAATNTSGTAQPINVINTGSALKGHPPAPFDGDRKKSKGFLLAFQLYRGLNRKNEAMSNPYNRVVTALTFIEGDNVDSWKGDQLEKLNNRVAGGYVEADETHWTQFEDAFKKAFTNTNEKAEAYQELTRLKQGESLDTFITEFKRLVGLAGIDADSHGVIELFKNALKSGLTKAIIGSHTFDPLNPWPTLEQWITAAHAQHIKWKMSQQFGQARDQKRQALYKAFGVKRSSNGGRRTTSQGGDAMDVDAAIVTNVTEAQKAELMKNNQCFYCQKRGHRAKECFKKKRDNQERSNSSRTPSQINNTKDGPAMTKEDIVSFLKQNMDTIDEDTRLSIADSLLPSDFVQALE